MNLEHLIAQKFNEIGPFRITFSMKNAQIVIIITQELFQVRQFYLHISKKIKNINNEYSVYKSFYGKKYIDLNNDDTLNQIQKNILLSSILENNKIDAFFNKINQTITNYAKPEKDNNYIKEFNVPRDKQKLYIYHLRTDNMTEKTLNSLVQRFNFDKNYLTKYIKNKGFTIVRTSDFKKRNKNLYLKIKNNDEKIEEEFPKK